MMQNSNRSTEICTDQLLSIPIDGRWIWDEKRKELVYESRNRVNQDKKLSSNESLKIDLRTGFIYYRKQNRPLQHIIKTKNNNKITLADVIQASLDVMSEIFYIPIEFEEYVRDRSQREKNRIRIAYANLLINLRELTCKYSVLLLGINLKDFHHMHNGDLFYSCTYLDRTIYESLFIFSTYFIWIIFYRENFDLIRNELARLFRADGDIEMLRIPMKESLEGRMKNDKLIDCTEMFSKSIAKETAHTRTSENETNAIAPERMKSMIWNWNKISQERNSLGKQRRSRDILEKDFIKQEKAEENDQLHSLEFHTNLLNYRRRHQAIVSQRKNRIHSILTKQLKNINQSLIEEQYHHLKREKKTNPQVTVKELDSKIRAREKMKREHLIKKQILNLAPGKNAFILPPPPNPLGNANIIDDHTSILPEVTFQLKENIGIIGESYSNFDLTRLTLKQNIDDSINIPNEFLVTLP
ncbi:unnamed protein product [Rotaria socialis]|uniref:Uncharacterized protein n=1 Tax=Rotaria socialis TaxID=392032 RepID=A0A821R266_9BILA|nr:unnamed protein product [Rotaria socialis]CAF4831071.1 unnamed protein product [Rotaria socialis]